MSAVFVTNHDDVPGPMLKIWGRPLSTFVMPSLEDTGLKEVPNLVSCGNVAIRRHGRHGGSNYPLNFIERVFPSPEATQSIGTSNSTFFQRITSLSNQNFPINVRSSSNIWGNQYLSSAHIKS